MTVMDKQTRYVRFPALHGQSQIPGRPSETPAPLAPNATPARSVVPGPSRSSRSLRQAGDRSPRSSSMYEWVQLLLALQAYGVVDICIHYVRVSEIRVEEIRADEERSIEICIA